MALPLCTGRRLAAVLAYEAGPSAEPCTTLAEIQAKVDIFIAKSSAVVPTGEKVFNPVVDFDLEW